MLLFYASDLVCSSIRWRSLDQVICKHSSTFVTTYLIPTYLRTNTCFKSFLVNYGAQACLSQLCKIFINPYNYTFIYHSTVSSNLGQKDEFSKVVTVVFNILILNICHLILVYLQHLSSHHQPHQPTSKCCHILCLYLFTW